VIFLTSIAANYLDKAQVLAETIKTHHPDSKVFATLMERKSSINDYSLGFFDGFIFPEDIWGENFETIIFPYTVVEACTAIKPGALLSLVKNYPGSGAYVFLDPDVYVMSPLQEIIDLIATYEIILTPHLTEPEKSEEGVLENEIHGCMRHGAYNLGFIAVSGGVESIKFLNWWDARLKKYCYEDFCLGLFTDQKWIDLVPSFFENVKILRHPGYNIAPWNISNRAVKLRDGRYFCNEFPIRFIHFTGFDSGANLMQMIKYCPDLSNPIFELRDVYISKLKETANLKKKDWTFANFLSGRKISHWHRSLYRTSPWNTPYVFEPGLISKVKVSKKIFLTNFRAIIHILKSFYRS